jgi:hypothetical protein
LSHSAGREARDAEWGDASYSLVCRSTRRDGALWAAVAGVGRVDDDNLRWVWGGARTRRWDWVRDSEERKEQSGDLGIHGDLSDRYTVGWVLGCDLEK